MYRNFRGVTVLSKEAKEFKRAVMIMAKLDKLISPLPHQVSVAIDYHPKSRKKENNKPLRRLDCDAHIKPVLDALIGIAYHDDYQVVSVACHLADPIPGGALIVTWEPA